MNKLGMRLNSKMKGLSSVQRISVLGLVCDLTKMQARLSYACVESILTTTKDIRLGQELSVLQVQRLLGLMDAAVNYILLDLLHMRPIQF